MDDASKFDLVKYRLLRAEDTLEDAKILAENKRWNACINRLYYAIYYAVSALLLNNDIHPTTHNGAKSAFSKYFINTSIFPKEMGRLYSQLFSWRQKGDYADLFDFDEERVAPYLNPVDEMIAIIKNKIYE